MCVSIYCTTLWNVKWIFIDFSRKIFERKMKNLWKSLQSLFLVHSTLWSWKPLSPNLGCDRVNKLWKLGKFRLQQWSEGLELSQPFIVYLSHYFKLKRLFQIKRHNSELRPWIGKYRYLFHLLPSSVPVGKLISVPIESKSCIIINMRPPSNPGQVYLSHI